jgi:hypothetical protein
VRGRAVIVQVKRRTGSGNLVSDTEGQGRPSLNYFGRQCTCTDELDKLLTDPAAAACGTGQAPSALVPSVSRRTVHNYTT